MTPEVINILSQMLKALQDINLRLTQQEQSCTIIEIRNNNTQNNETMIVNNLQNLREQIESRNKTKKPRKAKKPELRIVGGTDMDETN